MPKYIEYETLKKKINDAQAEKDKFPFNGSLHETGYHNGLTMALTLAMYSAAADVAPVRHGRWLNLYGDFSTAECELCGELYEVSPDESPKKEYFYAFNEFYRFCPNCGARMDGDAEAQQPHGIDAFIDACPKCSNRNSELCDECRCEKRGAFLPENKPSKRNAADAAEHKTIRERFEAVFPRCRIDEYGEPAEICPASLAGKECPATDKPTCMNCPAWDWPAE